MKERKHYIYGLKVEGTDQYFYIGYTNQNPIKRLQQHIKEAIEPSQRTLEHRLIMGGPSAKDKVIIDAIVAGKGILQDIIEDKALYEELDEVAWIQYYKSLGHPITNIAVGQQWQKQYKDANGKIFQLESAGKSLRSDDRIADVVEDIEFKTMMIQHTLKKIKEQLCG